MTQNIITGQDLEGSGHGLLWGTHLAFTWVTPQEKNTSTRIVGHWARYEPWTSRIRGRSANHWTGPMVSENGDRILLNIALWSGQYGKFH
jgi:hypothetical protein